MVYRGESHITPDVQMVFCVDMVDKGVGSPKTQEKCCYLYTSGRGKGLPGEGSGGASSITNGSIYLLELTLKMRADWSLFWLRVIIISHVDAGMV